MDPRRFAAFTAMRCWAMLWAFLCRHPFFPLFRSSSREMELFSFRTDAKREYEREMRRKQDHVEREFNPDSPNVIWVSDVTEIRHKNRKLYLCAVLDLFARRIVGF